MEKFYFYAFDCVLRIFSSFELIILTKDAEGKGFAQYLLKTKGLLDDETDERGKMKYITQSVQRLGTMIKKMDYKLCALVDTDVIYSTIAKPMAKKHHLGDEEDSRRKPGNYNQ